MMLDANYGSCGDDVQAICASRQVRDRNVQCNRGADGGIRPAKNKDAADAHVASQSIAGQTRGIPICPAELGWTIERIAGGFAIFHDRRWDSVVEQHNRTALIEPNVNLRRGWDVHKRAFVPKPFSPTVDSKLENHGPEPPHSRQDASRRHADRMRRVFRLPEMRVQSLLLRALAQLANCPIIGHKVRLPLGNRGR